MKTFKQLREESTALQPVKMMVVFSDGERKSYDVPKDTSFKDYVEKKIVPVEQGRDVVHYGVEKPNSTKTTVTSVKEAWEQTGKEGKHRETGEKTFEFKKVKTNKDGDVEETGERCWKNASGKMMGEDVEQLDELSPKTLGSYIKKAKSSAIGSSQVMGMGSNITGQKTQDRAEKNVQKRAAGINTAVDRLTKESVLDEKEKKSGLKDACWDGYEAIGMKDKNGKKVPNCVPVKESESLDEVSRNTLASYIKQAIADKEVAATASSFKSGKAGDEYNKAKTSNIESKRGKGIETALGKLTKESEDGLDEALKYNYGYKKPRKGTVAYDIMQQRELEDRKEFAKDPHGRLEPGDSIAGPNGTSTFVGKDKKKDVTKESNEDDNGQVIGEATSEKNYEYKNKSGKKANLASITYSDGDVEHIVTTAGGRPSRHSTKEKAHASLRVRGFEPTGEVTNESVLDEGMNDITPQDASDIIHIHGGKKDFKELRPKAQTDLDNLAHDYGIKSNSADKSHGHHFWDKLHVKAARLSEAADQTPVEMAKAASVKAGKSGSRQNHNMASQAHSNAAKYCEQNGDDAAAEFHRQRADFHTNNSLG